LTDTILTINTNTYDVLCVSHQRFHAGCGAANFNTLLSEITGSEITRRLGKAKRAQQLYLGKLGTLRFAQPTAMVFMIKGDTPSRPGLAIARQAGENQVATCANSKQT
jgi:hypothetical protein